MKLPTVSGGIRRWQVAAALWLAFSVVSAQEEAPDPKPAIEAPLADQSLMLDVIAHDAGYVAVGARGHVLLSSDGRQWRQAQSVPVQATLTRVTGFGRRLWAVGHDAVILSSSDGGENWFIQYRAPEEQEPLLDVRFVNANKGFAVGAYGRFMTTNDGGINWQSERLTDRVSSESIDWSAVARQQGGIETIPDEFQDEPADDAEASVNKGCYEFGECHLNSVLALDNGRMMIAAEAGYGFRSIDEGQSWESFRFPYPGSMFGLLAQRDCIIAFGLRGHIQRSCDFGSNWQEIPHDTRQSLLGGDVRSNDTAILVGAGATRIALEPDGTPDVQADQLGSDYAAVVAAPDGLILAGENGVRHE